MRNKHLIYFAWYYPVSSRFLFRIRSHLLSKSNKEIGFVHGKELVILFAINCVFINGT